MQSTLLRCCALPPSKFDDVICTSDGYYLARERGDIGHNTFLGKPNPHPTLATQSLTREAWSALGTLSAKKSLVRLARSRSINLHDFLRF